jgi:hypothetical protein
MKRKYTALIGYCSPSDYEKKFYQDKNPYLKSDALKGKI